MWDLVIAAIAGALGTLISAALLALVPRLRARARRFYALWRLSAKDIEERFTVNWACNIEASIEKLEKLHEAVARHEERIQRLDIVVQPLVPGMVKAGKIKE